jgi:hypothetical protein
MYISKNQTQFHWRINSLINIYSLRVNNQHSKCEIVNGTQSRNKFISFYKVDKNSRENFLNLPFWLRSKMIILGLDRNNLMVISEYYRLPPGHLTFSVNLINLGDNSYDKHHS